jgi:hypothetical protein
MDDIFDDNLEYWENRFYSDYGWIPRLDTQRGIDELQEFKDECRWLNLVSTGFRPHRRASGKQADR